MTRKRKPRAVSGWALQIDGRIGLGPLFATRREAREYASHPAVKARPVKVRIVPR